MSSNSHREGFDKRQDLQFLFDNPLTRDAKVYIIFLVRWYRSHWTYYYKFNAGLNNTIQNKWVSFQSYPPLSHCKPQPPICYLCYERLSNPPPMTSALRLGPSLAAAGFNKPATSPSRPALPLSLRLYVLLD